MDNSIVRNELYFLSEPNEEHKDYLIERLREYNRSRMETLVADNQPTPEPAPVEIYVQTAESTVIAGLIGRTNAIRCWLEISVLWVAENYRSQGLGRELVERAEEEARRRGCQFARLATSDYQAPGFYQKLGYRLYGTLEDCPPGVTNFYYTKNLTEATPATPL